MKERINTNLSCEVTLWQMARNSTYFSIFVDMQDGPHLLEFLPGKNLLLPLPLLLLLRRLSICSSIHPPPPDLLEEIPQVGFVHGPHPPERLGILVVVIAHDEERVSHPASDVGDHARIQVANELWLRRALLPVLAVPELAVTALARRLVPAHVVNVSDPRQDEGAISPGDGRHRMVIGEDRPSERPHKTGMVLIRLHAVAKTAVIAASPGEHPRDVSGGGRLHGHEVIPTAAHVHQAYASGVLERDALHLALGIDGAGRHHGTRYAIPIGLALHEDAPANELRAVGVPQLARGHDVLASLAVAELTEFGGPGGVQVPRGGK